MNDRLAHKPMLKLSAALLAALSLLVSCQGPTVDVLIRPDAGPTVYLTCESVFASARRGDACEGLEMDCITKSGCSVQTARCVGGVLFFSSEDFCPDCSDDLECGPKFLCLGGRCSECVAPSSCPPCRAGTTYLTRNGCATCECGPPSECGDGGCANGQACIRGTVCAEGCTRLDCCANVCAEPGCPEPAPLGCVTPCEDQACGGKCLAQACACDTLNKQWDCKGSCDVSAALCSAP